MALGSLLRRIESLLLDVFFPRQCVKCSKDGAWICPGCSAFLFLEATPRVFELESKVSAVCFLEFKELAVRELIHILKYNGISEAADTLCQLVKRLLGPSNFFDFLYVKKEQVVLVPVPTSKAKRKERGYNQAELLARSFADWLEVTCETGLLKRHFKKRSQVGKGKFERKQQVAASFFCNEKVLEKYDKGTCFVIIDDVCTTGSTLSACASLLKERGFAVIGCAIASSR